MANYESLPLYKLSFDILKVVTEKTKNFNNDYKYTIGKSLFNDSMQLVHQMSKAGISKNKSVHIQQMIELLEMIEIATRLSKELRLINIPAYAEITKLTQDAIKQSTGWLKSVNSK